eukprot:scaffold19435_cov73-Skeletonema_marinoi.AAC.5
MFRYYFVALYYAAELLWNVDEAKMIDGCVLIPASRTLNFYACVSYLARLTLTGTNSDVFKVRMEWRSEEVYQGRTNVEIRWAESIEKSATTWYRGTSRFAVGEGGSVGGSVAGSQRLPPLDMYSPCIHALTNNMFSPCHLALSWSTPS